MPDDLTPEDMAALRRLRRKPSNRPVKIYVGELTPVTTSEDLRTLFERYGPVTSAEIFGGGRFGRVVMTDGGRQAIERLNGVELHGKPIEVGELD
jgi:RNA recognition motif-containing protein